MRGSVLCLVFAKPPRPGLVKTRLAADLGAELAARLAGAFLHDTVCSLRDAGFPDVILSTPEPLCDHGVELPRWDQGAGDLGAKLERVLLRALASAPAVIAFGADSPGVPPEHLRQLGAQLADSEAVLAPTDDGGFWAIGLRRVSVGLFEGIPWSSPQTAAKTRERLCARGLSPEDGPSWWDIDVVSDLRRFRAEVPRPRAPKSHHVLDTSNWPDPAGAAISTVAARSS